MKNNNQTKDQGLRLAVQRETESAETISLSENFADRLMLRIETQAKPRRSDVFMSVLRVVSAAAAVVLVVLFLNIHRHADDNSDAHCNQTTDWTGGSTLRNLNGIDRQSARESFSYIRLKQKYYEKN